MAGGEVRWSESVTVRGRCAAL